MKVLLPTSHELRSWFETQAEGPPSWLQETGAGQDAYRGSIDTRTLTALGEGVYSLQVDVQPPFLPQDNEAYMDMSDRNLGGVTLERADESGRSFDIHIQSKSAPNEKAMTDAATLAMARVNVELALTS